MKHAGRLAKTGSSRNQSKRLCSHKVGKSREQPDDQTLELLHFSEQIERVEGPGRPAFVASRVPKRQMSTPGP
jgi:hypothetical protein